MRRFLLLAVLLTGCGRDEGDPAFLPVIQREAESITCRDWQGVQPDRQVQPSRARSRPDYCFVGEECFYDCPHKAGA